MLPEKRFTCTSRDLRITCIYIHTYRSIPITGTRYTCGEQPSLRGSYQDGIRGSSCKLTSACQLMSNFLTYIVHLGQAPAYLISHTCINISNFVHVHDLHFVCDNVPEDWRKSRVVACFQKQLRNHSTGVVRILRLYESFA